MTCFMKFKAALLAAGLLSGTASYAQTKSVNDLYLDFTLARGGNSTVRAIQIGEEILQHPEKLSPKTQVNFYYHLAKQYEVNHQDDKAVAFYEKVVAAEPDYYVPHMALGHLYLKPVNELVSKINASKNDRAAYQKYVKQFQEVLQRSIRHLERAQACDPNEELLGRIRDLYSRLPDKSGLSTLDSRLKSYSENCITVLTDDTL
mgnify:CR=1 FL=1